MKIVGLPVSFDKNIYGVSLRAARIANTLCFSELFCFARAFLWDATLEIHANDLFRIIPLYVILVHNSYIRK